MRKGNTQKKVPSRSNKQGAIKSPAQAKRADDAKVEMESGAVDMIKKNEQMKKGEDKKAKTKEEWPTFDGRAGGDGREQEPPTDLMEDITVV